MHFYHQAGGFSAEPQHFHSVLLRLALFSDALSLPSVSVTGRCCRELCSLSPPSLSLSINLLWVSCLHLALVKSKIGLLAEDFRSFAKLKESLKVSSHTDGPENALWFGSLVLKCCIFLEFAAVMESFVT